MSDSAATRRWANWVGITVLLFVFSSVYYGGVLSPRATVRWADFWWAAFALAAALRSFVAASRRTHDNERRGWRLLGLAALSWFSAEAYQIVGWLRDPEFVYYSSPSNLLFLAFAPLFVAGVFALRSGAESASGARVRMANFVILLSSSLLLAFVLLLEPLLSRPRPPAVVVFTILDPALFVAATLFALSCLWRSDPGPERRVLGWATAAIATHALSDVLYFHEVLVRSHAQTAQPDRLWIDMLWLVAFALQYNAAEEADLQRAHAQPTGRAQRGELMLSESLLPVAVVAAVVVAGVAFPEGLTKRVFVAAAPLALVLAVAIALREHWRNRDLAELSQELGAANERSRYLLSASPAAIVAGELRPALALSWASDSYAALGLGAEPERLIEALGPEDREALAARLEAVEETGQVALGATVRRADGEELRLDLQFRVSTRDGARRVVGSVLDVTDRHRLEAHVVRAQREESLGKLAGGVAHDFNNVLTTIQCHAEFALDNRDDETALQESMESILGAVGRGASLTRQLLAFSRPRLDQVEIVDAGAAVRQLLDLTRRVLGEDVELVTLIGSDPILVRTDPSRFEQVVMNLVLNARDAMPEGGRLIVEVRGIQLDEEAASALELSPGAYARIRVSDTGLGMDAETCARVFEPFFTTKGPGHGTGLGLATVHGIVTRHGGAIDVTSRIGRGSEFRVYLPANQPQLRLVRDGTARA